MDFGIFRPGLLRSTARETGAFSGTMRLACPEEPRIALHVVQRALAACFSGARDRLAYLEGLRECAARGGCAVHAYALMGVLPGLKAFAVAIIGGLGNPFGILIAGLLLGVVEFVVAIFNASLRDAVTFFLLIVILAWRPLGLFEKPSMEKV